MLKLRASLVLIAVMLVCAPGPASTDPSSGPTSIDQARDKKILSCFVYSLQTTPLLRQLQANIKKEPFHILHAGSYSGDRRTGKIQCALLDSEIVLNSLSKLVSEKILLKWKFYSIIQYGIIFNELYCNEMNEKSFKEQFLGTFKFTQSCIDEFMLKASKAK